MGQNVGGNEPREVVGEAPETQVVMTWRVSCDGGEGALGHPRVWIQIPEEIGWAECGYCDKRFVHETAATDAPVQWTDPHPEIP